MANEPTPVSADSPNAASPTSALSAGTRYYALAVLILINVLGYIDRHLLPAFATQISIDLDLSRQQFGLLIGIAFSSVDLTPRYEAALSRLRQDVIDGDIDPAHDLEALQVALSALLRGYRIFREPHAKRIDTDFGDLDDRVAAIVRTWLEAMAEPPATADKSPPLHRQN